MARLPPHDELEARTNFRRRTFARLGLGPHDDEHCRYQAVVVVVLDVPGVGHIHICETNVTIEDSLLEKLTVAD